MSKSFYVKFPLCLSNFNKILIFNKFSEHPQISNSVNIGLVKNELFDADKRDKQMEGWTERHKE